MHQFDVWPFRDMGCNARRSLNHVRSDGALCYQPVACTNLRPLCRATRKRRINDGAERRLLSGWRAGTPGLPRLAFRIGEERCGSGQLVGVAPSCAAFRLPLDGSSALLWSGVARYHTRPSHHIIIKTKRLKAERSSLVNRQRSHKKWPRCLLFACASPRQHRSEIR